MRMLPSPHVLALVLALTAMFALLALAEGVAAIEFQPEPTPITGSTAGDQRAVAMATGPEDLLYAVWVDDRYTSASRGEVLLFAWSEVDQRGRDWSDANPIPASAQANDMNAPAISVGPDGRVHLVWQELQRGDDVSGGPYWEVWYALSENGGIDWKTIRLSQPNNRNNTLPSVAALPGASALVAWELEDHPGTSLALTKVEQGSRAWYREDLAASSEDWELNGHVSIAADAEGDLHMAWQAQDMNGMWVLQRSQIMYLMMKSPGRDTAPGDVLALADRSTNVTNSGPALVATRRHGTWVAWVAAASPASMGDTVAFLADGVVDGRPGTDLLIAELTPGRDAEPSVAASSGLDDGVVLALAGVGSPGSPPLFTSSCSEQGCFAEPRPVVPAGTTVGWAATIAVDSLDNVYVGWDDGEGIWCTQRRNNPPGPPELLRPDRSTNDEGVEFVWSFNDVDAGAFQSSFHIQYSPDPGFPGGSTLGGVVSGALGRSTRYVSPDPLEEGRWYWRVSTRDNLGLWSVMSATGDFLADRTPPVGSVVINGGNDFTDDRVVVLLLNATDNLEDLGGEMYFQISSDPNFPNASKHEWPPPNNQVNQELPPGEGIKVVFFRFFDASGLHHTSMDTIIYNETLILIVHVPVTTAPLGKSLNISCEIMRASEVATTLFYRKSFEDEFTEMEMAANGSQFWAIIPRDDVSIRGMFYYIKARTSGGSATSPETSPVEEPYEIKVYETTEEYQPPIYNPLLTFTGALAVLVVLVLLWWYRLRVPPP